MDALLLGSGGWIPTSRRETCCAYLRSNGHVLLIDAGTGVQRLVENPELLAGVERLDIVLTHFHLDHVVGLTYLPALPLLPAIWGPGELTANTTTKEILGRLIGRPLFAATPGDIAGSVHEIPPKPFQIGPFAISPRVQRLHTDPTLALRVGDALTYCTDTAADPGNADFAAGSRLLLHEAWYAEASTDDETHSAAGEAGQLARTAGVDRLVLIHINPLQRSDDELARHARAEFPHVSVGQDLEPLRGLEVS
jgi:ribonuclease BN (tRNA processing enzyme)